MVAVPSPDALRGRHLNALPCHSLALQKWVDSPPNSLVLEQADFIAFPVVRDKSPFFIRPIANAIKANVESMFLNPSLDTNFAFLESQVKSAPDGGGYLCGSKLTGADILVSFPLGAAKGRSGFTKEKYPALWNYVNRLEERDGFKKAVQKIVDVEGSYDPSL